jgi:hypothetical protein
MTKYELIDKYLNAQSEEEIQTSMELMNHALCNATTEEKETLKAVVYEKNEMLIRETNDFISQIDSVILNYHASQQPNI